MGLFTPNAETQFVRVVATVEANKKGSRKYESKGNVQLDKVY